MGQNLPLSEKLQQKITALDANEYVRVRIEFNENVNCTYLSQEFKTNKTPIAERSKKVISELTEQAKNSQTDIIEFLENQSTVKELKTFWVVNLIVCDLQKSTLLQLGQFSNIALIDLENNKYIPTEEVEKGTQNLSKSIDGVEPGLSAINAPAMWALGYTGRGRMVYDYDTGVWPTHRAFSDRFMANHYPMDQCWYGYFSDVPTGIINSHGTHTLGTIAGLDETTNDTIGVAFKSYWIANDFVTPTVAGLPPITDMIGAF
jgi:subtilisin family serine protease